MSLQVVIANLATRVATECKSLRTLINGNAADLTALTTTAKGNLVVAVNELKAAITALGTPAVINDSATNGTQTWSSTKVNASITSALNAAIAGAPAALDTLNELALAIGNDASFASTMTVALGNRVRFDAVQTLTTPQQLQACTNIGVGDPETNFVTTFNAGLV
jgi:formate-dependent phosphoribosylglycinamide formyltransferase (GAR transformylase)